MGKNGPVWEEPDLVMTEEDYRTYLRMTEVSEEEIEKLVSKVRARSDKFWKDAELASRAKGALKHE